MCVRPIILPIANYHLSTLKFIMNFPPRMATNSANGNLLSVTSPHEDEGYLSPSEEDLKRSLVLSANIQRGLNKSVSELGPISAKKEKEGDSGEDGREEDKCGIPWEVIMNLPDVREEHLSWDRLKLPVPYRFYDDHVYCLRQVRKASNTTYVTDSIEKQAEVVENMWRFSTPPEVQKEDQKIVGESQCQLPPVDVNLPLISEALAVIKSAKDPITYISTDEYVKDVFNLLCGRESTTFSRVSAENFEFVKNSRVLVRGLSPGVLISLSKDFMKAGKIFKRLSHMSALHFDERLLDREGLQGTPVFIAFLRFVSDYLKLYQPIIMLKETSICSISKLNSFFKPLYYQLQTLEFILELYISTDQITLLKGLNSMMLSCETPFIADLIRSAFISCAAAYLRYVSEWIFRGQITNGFHIQKTKSGTYFDRRYWVKQFSQVSSVPTFMENAVHVIFETGKAINLLTLIRNMNQGSALLSSVFHDESSIILPAVNFEDVASLDKVWKEKTDCFFEEYSFLETGIEVALSNVGESKKMIDFSAVEDAKQAFEIKRLTSRRQFLDKKTEKQKELYKILNEQVEEKKFRQDQEKKNEMLENEKIMLHMKTQDERDLSEEIRLMKKHFGERISETVGLKNVKKRMAAFPVKPATDSSGDKPMEMNSVNEEGSGLTEIDTDLLSFEDVKHSSPTKHSFLLAESSDRDSNETRSGAPSQCINECVELEDAEADTGKFNSDNLIVRKPVPYNLDLKSPSISDAMPNSIVRLLHPTVTDEESELHDADAEFYNSRHDSFCLNFFLNQTVTIPVGAQNQMINATLLHYFIVEQRLFKHVEALNSYLCLQNGLFGHYLTTMLIHEVKSGTWLSKADIPRKAGRLNELLREAISLSVGGSDSDFRDHLGFILVRESSRNSMDFDSQKSVKSKTLTSAYEVLDDVTVNYSVKWPLSILLTEELLINYEKLFAFQMRLYRAEILLLGLSSILKFKGSKSKQLPILHHYRWRMLHFVRTVRHYINVTVIHSAWTDLLSSFYKMDSLDKLYEGLVRHIKFVTTNCLLGTKGEGVKKLLLDQLTVIECFCTDVEDCARNGISWDSGDEIPSRRFHKLDQKFKVWEEIQKVFIQVFFKLATRGTYQKVAYFLQLFNFNSYFGNNLLE